MAFPIDRCAACPKTGDGPCRAQQTKHARFCELADPAHEAYISHYREMLEHWPEPVPTLEPAPAAPIAEGPSLATKAVSFVAAVVTHVAAGMPAVDDATFAERINACLACPNSINEAQSCRLCGCNLRLKARWATTSCPDSPPRWLAVSASTESEN